MRSTWPLALIVLGIGECEAEAADIVSDFTSEKATFQQWNDCQADRRYLKFRSTDQRAVLRNTITKKTGNKDTCPDSCKGAFAETEDEDLGPSLIFTGRDVENDKNCPKPDLDKNGDEIPQRNELRLQNLAENCHPTGEKLYYTLTFKVDEASGDKIPSCGSIRWINAQWKYGIVPKGEKVNDSPFLAQRFDNGVLHVTVEDGHCRCMIAQSSGDPYEMVEGATLRKVEPLRCLEDETECTPPNLELWAVSPDVLKSLPDPKKDWVTMRYQLETDQAGRPKFTISANGSPIVVALGAQPGGVNLPNKVKFKFGHYRDRFKNRTSTLFDRICVATDEKICAKAP